MAACETTGGALLMDCLIALGGKRGFVTILFSDPGGDKIPTKGKLYEMFAKHISNIIKMK